MFQVDTTFSRIFRRGRYLLRLWMVLCLAIPIAPCTAWKISSPCATWKLRQVMLATGLIVGYGYGIEAFMGGTAEHVRSFLLWNVCTDRMRSGIGR